MKSFFAGRETDIQRLMAFAADAFAGKTSIAFITGEAGIGKTTLAKELIRQLQSNNQDMVVASGKCTVNEASYLPFRTILETLVNSEKRFIGNNKKSRKFMEVVFDTIWTAGPDLIGIFGIPIKALQSTVEKHGLRTKMQVREMTIPKDLDQNQIYGWYTKIIQEISGKFPMVLFLDDLHWADESSLNLLFHLGRELENNKIFVIASYRPYDVNPDSRLLDIKTRLERYGAQEFSLDVSEENAEDIFKIRKFIHAYLIGNYGTNFSERFESMLADCTEGNALFLTEILKNMEEKGQIVCFQQDIEGEQAIQWKLTKETENIENLPKKIESVIRERINRLEKGLREILNYASVQGDDFLAQVIAKARQIDDWTLIDELTEKLMNMFQLIWERGGKSLPNGNRVHEFSFRHNLLREYVYVQIPKSKKEHLHSQIGAYLEHIYEPKSDDIAGTLAVHFRLGYVLPKTVFYSLKAVQDANSRYGTVEAVRFAEMGIEALEECRKSMSAQEYAENKIQLLIELAKAEEYGGNPQEKKDHIHAGISILEENQRLLQHVSEKLQAEFYLELAKLYQRKGRKPEETKAYLEKALSIYEKIDDPKQIAEICYSLGGVYDSFPSSEGTLTPFEITIDILKRSLKISKHLRDYGLQSRILSKLARKYMEKDFGIAQEYAKQAMELSTNSNKIDKYAEIRAIRAIAVIYDKYSKHKTAIKYEKKALELTKQTGNMFEQAASLNNVGYYNCYMSLINNARLVLEESIVIKNRIGSKKDISLSNLAWIFARQGEWKQAELYWRKCFTESSKKGQSFYLYNIGRLYTFQEKYAEAEAIFIKRINMLKNYSSPSHSVYIMTAQNYAKLGNETESRKLLEIANMLFEKKTLPPRNKSLYFYGQAEVYQILGEYEMAKATCEQSLTWFFANAEDPEDYQYVAEARLVMGKILVGMGRNLNSIEYLEKAKNAFAIGKHYALGETMLYLCKAHLGIGNKPQAKTLITEALAEFQRLELPQKELEAREILSNLRS